MNNETTDTAALKKREAKLRRMAARMGLALRKSRVRDPDLMEYGCFRIVDIKTGRTVTGAYPYPYSLDLDRVEEALHDIMASPHKPDNLKWRGHAEGCAGGDEPRYDDES